MNGLLNVHKPRGITSHDVVNAVRRLAGMRRVGHAGTLDPAAEGVLVLLLGAATRLSQYVMGAEKTYRAVLKLGETTTTYDAEGEITARRPPAVTREAIAAALADFRGPLMQVPPMYSAIKQRGKKLYELARQGREVPRPPRPVTIYHLELLAWNEPHLTLEVTCSAGTYIRSLAHDLGQVLGCGAHLASLIRTASGSFLLSEAHPLEELRHLAERGQLERALLPPQAALYALPAVTLTPQQARAVRHGQTVTLAVPPADALQALDAEGRLLAVLLHRAGHTWRPKTVLAT